MIADFIKDSRPQNVVVELCDERFNAYFNDVMKHPKYEMLIGKFYQILHDEEKAKTLSEKSNLIDLKGMEYLIAIDFWSYRMLRWRSVLGDRNWTITTKRMKAKSRLSSLIENSESDLMSMSQIDKDKNEINQIKNYMEKTSNDEEDTFDFNKIKSDTLTTERKTHEQIYQEIFIDEINQELLKNINKCEGKIVDVLVNKERVSSFEKLWKNTYEEHYRDMERKDKLKEIEEKHVKKKVRYYLSKT